MRINQTKVEHGSYSDCRIFWWWCPRRCSAEPHGPCGPASLLDLWRLQASFICFQSDAAFPNALFQRTSSESPPSSSTTTTSLVQEWQMMVPDLSAQKQKKPSRGSGACKQEAHGGPERLPGGDERLPRRRMFVAGLRLAGALKTSSPWTLPTPTKPTRRAFGRTSLEPWLRGSWL